MDSLKSLDFSSFIIFSDDPSSLLVKFCLFKLPLVVQCCDVICEWPLIVAQSLIYKRSLVDSHLLHLWLNAPDGPVPATCHPRSSDSKIFEAAENICDKRLIICKSTNLVVSLNLFFSPCSGENF